MFSLRCILKLYEKDRLSSRMTLVVRMTEYQCRFLTSQWHNLVASRHLQICWVSIKKVRLGIEPCRRQSIASATVESFWMF